MVRLPAERRERAASGNRRPLAAAPATHETVRRLAEQWPNADVSAVEANFAVVRVYGALASAMETFLAPWGLNPARLTLLRVLYEALPHPLTAGQIRQRLNVTSTNVSKLVRGLEARGLVHRTEGQEDHRLVEVQLTERGIAEFETVMPLALNQMELFWQNVPAEARTAVIDATQTVRQIPRAAKIAPKG